MFDERHKFLYFLAFGILVTLKIGLYDTIREFQYARNKTKIENRKYIFGAKILHYSTFKWLDEYEARRICLFAYIGDLGFFVVFFFLNLS